MRWFHGLAAYNRVGGKYRYCPVETRQRVEVIRSGVEIAGADKPIGAFGVVVDGDTYAVFESDVWSTIKRGFRYTENRHNVEEFPANRLESTYIPEDRESAVHQWCADIDRDYVHGDYCEAFVGNCSVLAVWCKDNASDARYWQARSLALKLRVPFVEVTEQTRIGNWCGTVEQLQEEEA